MATRQFDFIVGPETSTLPTVGTPTSGDDLITLDFADARYTQGSEAVADITALKAIASAERRNGDFVLVMSTNNVYRFDSASVLSGDDNFVATPAVGTGRWIRVTILNRANTFTDTTQSTDKDTGGAVFEGGVGIEKNLNVGGNVIVTGDFTVSGTTTTVNSTVMEVVDPNIVVNKGGSTASADSAVAGITVITSGTSGRLGYTSSLQSKFKIGDLGSESEIMTVGHNQTVAGLKTYTTTLVMDNGQEIRFNEVGGADYIGFRAPNSVPTSVTFKWPSGDGSLNQVLTTDGSANLSWSTVATDALNEFNIKVGNSSNIATAVNTNTTGDLSFTSTGGGTVKATTNLVVASLTVDTNTLFVDATNNRVGIITATPSYPLHVNTSNAGAFIAYFGAGGANTTSALVAIDSGSTSGAAAELRLLNGGTLNASVKSVVATTNLLISTANSYTIDLAPNGTTRMVLNPSATLSAPGIRMNQDASLHIGTQVHQSDSANSMNIDQAASTWVLSLRNVNATSRGLKIVTNSTTVGAESLGIRRNTSSETSVFAVDPYGNMIVGGTNLVPTLTLNNSEPAFTLAATSGAEAFVRARSTDVLMGSSTNHDLSLRTNMTDRITLSATKATLASGYGLTIAETDLTGSTTVGNVASGNVASTLTTGTNTNSTSFASSKFNWHRVGDVIAVSGRVVVNVTGTGAANFSLSIPIARTAGNFAGPNDVIGVVTINIGTAYTAGVVERNGGSQLIQIQFNAASTGTHTFYVSYLYNMDNN